MSEYQYYEFRAIDRLLTEAEMAELREFSTRADITPTSFTNEYHWGNFRGNPRKMMEKYFDAFVYWANWGTHQFMLRLPRTLVDTRAAAAYCVDDSLTIETKKDFVILEFHSEDESGDWDEAGWGTNWMAALVPVRADLLGGDLRALYLGWLAGVQAGEVEDDEVEPPLPPGMGRLSAPLKNLADFLRIDDGLIDAAAEADQGEAPSEPSKKDLAAWVRALPAAEKDDLLVAQVTSKSSHLRQQLVQRFRREHMQANLTATPAKGKRRTVGQLREAAKRCAQLRQQREAEERARRQEKEARKKAAQREKYLDDLASRETQTWKKIDRLLKSTSTKRFIQTVDLLVDLRDAAARKGTSEKFTARLAKFRSQNSRSPALMKRMGEKGLG